MGQPAQARRQIVFGAITRPSYPGGGDDEVDPKFNIQSSALVACSLGFDSCCQTGKKRVGRLRIRHRQDDGVTCRLPSTPPGDEQRRLAHCPFPQKGRVLRMPLKRSGSPRLEDRGMEFASGEYRRKDTAAGSEGI